MASNAARSEAVGCSFFQVSANARISCLSCGERCVYVRLLGGAGSTLTSGVGEWRESINGMRAQGLKILCPTGLNFRFWKQKISSFPARRTDARWSLLRMVCVSKFVTSDFLFIRVVPSLWGSSASRALHYYRAESPPSQNAASGTPGGPGLVLASSFSFLSCLRPGRPVSLRTFTNFVSESDTAQEANQTRAEDSSDAPRPRFEGLDQFRFDFPSTHLDFRLLNSACFFGPKRPFTSFSLFLFVMPLLQEMRLPRSPRHLRGINQPRLTSATLKTFECLRRQQLETQQVCLLILFDYVIGETLFFISAN